MSNQRGPVRDAEKGLVAAKRVPEGRIEIQDITDEVAWAERDDRH